MTSTINSPALLRKKLARWFRVHGRDLPWRRTRDPYAIAVSEIMLQQTTAKAVIPFFERWMKEFPDVATLAKSSDEAVLKAWQGLGYYSRARNLHQSARQVVQLHGGEFPSDPALMASLPGFGPYTSAAVAAFAFDSPVAVIDTNVARVLARLGDVHKPIDRIDGRLALQALAGSLLPRRRGGRILASSLMELGATVCRSGVPDCEACPIREFCMAPAPALLPRKAPHKAVTPLEEMCGFFVKGRRVALVPAPGPRWRGLWVLPPTLAGGPVLHFAKFSVTRYRITMQVIGLKAKPGSARLFPLSELPPMPSPHARALHDCVNRRFPMAQ